MSKQSKDTPFTQILFFVGLVLFIVLLVLAFSQGYLGGGFGAPRN